jgi:hypothetical protein
MADYLHRMTEGKKTILETVQYRGKVKNEADMEEGEEERLLGCYAAWLL